MPQNFEFKFVPSAARGGWTSGSIVRRSPIMQEQQMSSTVSGGGLGGVGAVTTPGEMNLTGGDRGSIASRTDDLRQVLPRAQESVVGPVNAMAQNDDPAAMLRTDATGVVDPVLGSRLYKNPNTGIRDPIASGSVYAMSNVPAYLSQTVAALNEEQSLKRALQAEWNNRLLQGVASGGPDAYLFAEALRAASVSPGASASFGQRIADPNVGRAQQLFAQTQAKVEADRLKAFQELEQARRQLAQTTPSSPDRFALMDRIKQLEPAASYVGRGTATQTRQAPAKTTTAAPGFNSGRIEGTTGAIAQGLTGGGWSPRYVNPFNLGYF